MVQFCTNCGNTISQGENFCRKCGTPVRREIYGQNQNFTVEMNGCCVKCGAQLIKGAMFCSKCREPVRQAMQPEIHTSANNIRTEIRNIPDTRSVPVQNTGIFHAASQAGEMSFNVPDFSGNIIQTAGRKFGIMNLLTGLGAGGISFAALWNVQHPLVTGLCVSAGVVIMRVIVGLIRRRGK